MENNVAEQIALLQQGRANAEGVLEDALATPELYQRSPRSPNYEAENAAMVMLAQGLATAPETTLQQLCETAMNLCHAQSAAISILETEAERTFFRWEAISGAYAPHLHETIPGDFLPGAIALAENAPQLVIRPGAHFPCFQQDTLLIEEGLLVPFHLQGRPVGTLWVLRHDQGRGFDQEDVRVLTNLSAFAAAARKIALARDESQQANTRLQNELTRHKETEATLRAAQARLSDLLEGMSDAFIAVDKEWRITYANREAARINGKAPQEFLGRTLWAEWPAAVSSPLEEAYRRAIATHKPVHLEHRYIDADHDVWLEIDAYPTSEGLGIFYHDITERQQGEQALRASQADLQFAVNGAQLGTFYCELPFDVIIWNETCKEHFFLPSDARVNFDLFYALLHPDDREPIRQAIDRCMNERVQYNVEYRVVAPDGRTRWINAVGRGVYDANGEPYRFDGITIDITARKRAQQEIEDLNVRLRRAMTETHHRVKNNLQLMAAMIDMQRSNYGDLVPAAELRRLEQNVQALGIIHDILTHTAKTDGDARTLSIKAVLTRLLPSLQGTLTDRALRFVVEDGWLEGRQATSLALILNELVSNAAKHGKGDIEVALAVRDNRATLKVCDDGPGFPPGFDAVAAAHTGLELIEHITRWDLSGETRYENQAGGGAQVVISFPVLPTEAD